MRGSTPISTARTPTLWSRESFGSKKAEERKKTFLVTSETEGSVVQLVTVDHQAPPTNKQLTACCVFIFFSRSPSLEHIEDGELVERTTAESSNKF